MLLEVYHTVANAYANALDMKILAHKRVYESQVDAIKRFMHEVNFRGDDVALVPRILSSSSSSASTARLYQAPSSSTR